MKTGFLFNIAHRLCPSSPTFAPRLLLLQHGADGAAQDNEGRLPIHWATDNPNAEVMSVLLNRVPGLNIK